MPWQSNQQQISDLPRFRGVTRVGRPSCSFRSLSEVTVFAAHPSDATALPVGDEVFAALDQQRIGDGTSGWQVYVQGVHTVGPDLWVQISRNNDPADTVIVQLVPDASAGDVVAALQRVGRSTRTARVVKAAPRGRASRQA